MKSQHVKIVVCMVGIGILFGSFLFLCNISKHNQPLKNSGQIALEQQKELSGQISKENKPRPDKEYFEKYIKPAEDKFIASAKANDRNDKNFEELIKLYDEVADKMNQECSGQLYYDDDNDGNYVDALSDDYYKDTWVKLLLAEGDIYFNINYSFLAERYKEYISPAYYEWLKHKSKTIQIAEDAGITVEHDKLREYIIYLENFKKKYPDFVAINDVKDRIKWYLQLYLFGLDNTPIFDFSDKKLKPEIKSSYEKYLSENKGSEYYYLVEELYNKSKASNFIEDNKFKEWHIKFFQNHFLNQE